MTRLSNLHNNPVRDSTREITLRKITNIHNSEIKTIIIQRRHAARLINLQLREPPSFSSFLTNVS